MDIHASKVEGDFIWIKKIKCINAEQICQVGRPLIVFEENAMFMCICVR